MVAIALNQPPGKEDDCGDSIILSAVRCSVVVPTAWKRPPPTTRTGCDLRSAHFRQREYTYPRIRVWIPGTWTDNRPGSGSPLDGGKSTAPGQELTQQSVVVSDASAASRWELIVSLQAQHSRMKVAEPGNAVVRLGGRSSLILP